MNIKRKICVRNWESLTDLFSELNAKCDYLVLRNFEQMSGDEFLMDGHEDIDFLCSNPEELIMSLGAFPRKFYNKKVQNYILFKGKKVKIDIRYVGDNYYDKTWQMQMLRTKVMNKNGFWTMNQENYFYSLIYHAILQKSSLSDEYFCRLVVMAKSAGFEVDKEADLLQLLEDMMQKNGYKFVYPQDGSVPNRFNMLSNKPSGKVKWIIRKILIKPQESIYWHLFQKLGGGKIL